MSQSFETYFKALIGSWSLFREISSGENFQGKTEFEAVSETLFLMREAGELVLPDGKKISASRNWYWHLIDSNTLEVTYDGGRLEPYHLVNLDMDKKAWHGTAEHLCGDDLYSGDYAFLENRFVTSQTIKGPKKDYTVTSIYSR